MTRSRTIPFQNLEEIQGHIFRANLHFESSVGTKIDFDQFFRKKQMTDALNAICFSR